MLLSFGLSTKKVFLFKGSGYWQWDELAPTDFSRYPKPIKGLFTECQTSPRLL